MGEYIEREAAKKVAERYGCTNGATLGRHSGLADCIASEIEALPAADVAPVRHGRWNRYGRNLAECSNCGEIVNIRYNYCPNCGCKMLEDLDGKK